jgi:hypothetical protein
MSEEAKVQELGDKIGYGRIMQLAQELWRNKLALEGMAGGELTVGPCAAMMVPCIHPVVDSNGHCKVCCGSGSVTKWIATLTQ